MKKKVKKEEPLYKLVTTEVHTVVRTITYIVKKDDPRLDEVQRSALPEDIVEQIPQYVDFETEEDDWVSQRKGGYPVDHLLTKNGEVIYKYE